MRSIFDFKKFFSAPNHLIQFFVVVCCLYFSVLQVTQCIERLLVPPITTYYGFHLNESMTYPSVTICRRPGFNFDYFPKYGFRSGQSLLTHNIFRSFNFDNYTIKDFLEDTTYKFDEVFGSYAYNGFGANLAATKLTSFDSISYGKCFTFTPLETSTTYSISGGWWFYLKHDMTERDVDSFGVSESGYHVYVHDANEIMTSEHEQDDNFLEYIYVEASEDIRLHLRHQDFQRVNTNENPCIDPTVQPYYSRSRCIEECFNYQVANLTNCTLPWLWMLPDDWLPQCNSEEELILFASLYLSHNRRSLVANCSCPKSCHVTVYTPSIISRKQADDNPNVFLAMYYGNNIVTEMREMIGYNVSAFVADIGGSLGFLLGLSVIGFIKVLEKLVCLVIKYYYERRRKKKNSAQESFSLDAQSNVSNDSTKIVDNESIGKRNNETNLYANLRDFESDDFKHYQKTLITQRSNKF